MNTDELFAKLQSIDTPTITNVVATYASDKNCLGLYNPWTVNWYTDQTCRCIYPELRPRAGYAVTVQYGMPDKNFTRLGFVDLLKAIEASPKPVVVVMRQNLPPEIKNKNGLSGGNMTTAMQTLGCVGVVSDGPSRDMGDIRGMDFQYLLTGVCAGHGDFSVEAVNIPVSVCGMDVAPGEIVHMDESGACKFPAAYLDEVVKRSFALLDKEASRMEKMRTGKTAEEVFAYMSGFQEKG
ncbi:MAG: RraA family protein [Oscillospiraceae bacterium]|nr:RraA family protein [Oscillospiraceae bacterium]